LNSLNRE